MADQQPPQSFDAAKYIHGPAATAELLNDALRSDSPAYIAAALGVAARAIGMTRLAQATGVNRQALYTALSEDGNPTLDTLVRVIIALGLRLRFEPRDLEPADGDARNDVDGRLELDGFAGLPIVADGDGQIMVKRDLDGEARDVAKGNGRLAD